MKDDLLAILPKSIGNFMQKDMSDPQGNRKSLIDAVAEEAAAYDFHSEEIVPCLHAAYYAYESTAFPDDWDEEQKRSVVFMAACRATLKLLSYGKYKAARSESGWMQYEKQ